MDTNVEIVMGTKTPEQKIKPNVHMLIGVIVVVILLLVLLLSTGYASIGYISGETGNRKMAFDILIPIVVGASVAMLIIKPYVSIEKGIYVYK
jgi:hypothetical protein